MSRSRVPIILALAFFLIGAASALQSAPAYAADSADWVPAVPLQVTPVPTPAPYDTITVGSAVTTIVPAGADGPGGEELTLTVTSTTPLTSLTVQLSDPTTENTAAPAMSQLAADATTGVSTWSSGIITMPLGTYDVTVSAADEGGATVTGASAGTFAFQETPTVTMTVNQVLSYSNQHPVLSGTITTLVPGAASPEPYADAQVVLADSVLNSVTLTTNASGGFSYPFADPQPGEAFTVQVLPTDTVAAASSATDTFTVYPDQVAIAASLSAKAVTYGGKVTVSGTVSYAPGGTSVPFPGETVRIYNRAGATAPVATAVTGSGGRFTAVLPRQSGTVHWVLQAGGPYLGTASVTLPMKVSLPTLISGFQATLNPYWQVSFHGCLALPAGVPGDVPSLSGLTIQYAPSPSGPWHKLGAVPSQQSAACGHGGRTFSGKLPTPLNYGYYRAWYAGGTDVTGTGYLASASVKAFAWKYEDRITSFSVSPRTVAERGKLTVTGVLQFYSGKWRNYASQQILIILRPQGSKGWFWITKVNTNSSGKFTATFADPVTATWSAEYQGNSAHLATVAAMVKVTVR